MRKILILALTLLPFTLYAKSLASVKLLAKKKTLIELKSIVLPMPFISTNTVLLVSLMIQKRDG